MKQISDRIILVPIMNIQSQWRDSITFTDSSKNYKFTSCQAVTINQEPERSEAGLLYNCSIIAIAQADRQLMLYNNSRIVVILTMMDRTIRTVGSKDVPAIIIITPAEGLYKISITAKLLEPIIF